MNNKIRLIITLLTMTLSAFAQDDRGGGEDTTCARLLLAKDADLDEDAKSRKLNCQKIQLASQANGFEATNARESKTSIDKKITCMLRKGYTFDYNDCSAALSAYNGILIAEKAMFTQQKVRQDIKASELQEETAKEAAKGNLQRAALDATAKANSNLSQMYKEQVYVYSTAVATLGAVLTRWQGKGPRAAKRVCKKINREKKDGEQTPAPADPPKMSPCEEAVTHVANSYPSEAFANSAVRGQLLIISADYIIKAAEAQQRAGITEETAKKLSEIPQDILDEDALFEKCQLMPTDPACSNNNRVDTGTFEGSNITFGEGNGNNAFTFGDKPSSEGELNDVAPKGEAKKVGDVSNSFQEDAEKANEILNPSKKATISQGSQNSPGGGGGGGAGGGMGGAGGGGGGDEAAAAGDGEPVIDAKAHKGNYASSGSGFDSVKGSKEEANPYASLFDAKGENGGIEEDRSIASEDGSGVSGLFQKISRRYGQVYDAKRIETNNLE